MLGKKLNQPKNKAKSRLLRLTLCTMTAFSLYSVTALAEGAPDKVTNLSLSQGEQVSVTITSFSELDDDYARYTIKPALEDAIAAMPTTITGYINGTSETIIIPLTWECTVDYEDSNDSYYLFYASWDESKYQLCVDYNPEGYEPFFEIEIGTDGYSKTWARFSSASAVSQLSVADTGTLFSSSDTSAQLSATAQEVATLSDSSDGVANIISRAYHQLTLAWTPLKDVNGYTSSSGEFYGIHLKGVTYLGLPYGQQVQNGRYVPHKASLDTFIDAVEDSASLLYTSRGKYYSRDSAYYASDCSAFVSYCYGLTRMTTTTIAKSSQFTKVSGNNVYNAKVGDCFNHAGDHVELIAGLYYTSGILTGIEVVEQTPPMMHTVVYTPAELQKVIDNGKYTLLRFDGRSSVAEPDHYDGCYDMNSAESSSEVTICRGDVILTEDGAAEGTSDGGSSGSASSDNGSGATSSSSTSSTAETWPEAGSTTVITWPAFYDVDHYELKLWRGKDCLNGKPYYRTTDLVDNTCELELPAGHYEGYIDTITINEFTVNRQYISFIVSTKGSPDACRDGHAWNAGSTTLKATCVSYGYKTYTCSRCGQTKRTQLAINDNHSYNSGKVTKEATCKESGTKLYTCTLCGATKTETVAKLTTHTYNSGTVTKTATCIATGTKLYTCTVCGATKTSTIAKNTNHTYDSGKVTKAATYTTTGVKTYTCTLCGATKTESIPVQVFKITTQPTDKTILAGNKASFSIKVSGYNLSYQWQYKKPGESSWTSSASASGKSANYTYSNYIGYSANGTQLRCIVKSEGKTLTSNVITITVEKFEFTSVANSTKGITLKWKAAAGADGYEIYRKTGTGSYTKLTTIASSSTTSYTDTTVKNGTTYAYKIRYYVGSSCASFSTEKALKYLAAPTPAAVVSSGKVKVSWDRNASASGYYVYRKTGSGSYQRVATITSNSTLSYTDSSTVTGNTYTYTVRAFSGAVLSGYYSGASVSR